jgi:hypothetical protein
MLDDEFMIDEFISPFRNPFNPLMLKNCLEQVSNSHILSIALGVFILIMKLNIIRIGFVQMLLWSLEFVTGLNDHENHFFHCII